jgi:hypothetical protein
VVKVNERLCEWLPLARIDGQNIRLRSTQKDQAQLRALRTKQASISKIPVIQCDLAITYQVVGVHAAGVHALASFWRVRMARITS